MSRIALLIYSLLLLSPFAKAQDLQKEIARIAASSQGKVSVSCSLPGVKLACDYNAQAQPPMQSVFKLPLALAVLHHVEQGKLRIDQTVHFEKRDRILPKTYSPLQDKYPEADIDVPLQEVLALNVSQSDNAASELLLRILGGPPETPGLHDLTRYRRLPHRRQRTGTS